MNHLSRTFFAAAALAAAALPVGVPRGAAAQETRRVRVLATTTDLREIAREVGGDAVDVVSLTRGPEDPHFLDARPSFVRMAHDADLFLKVGLDLEAGYEGPLVLDARNPRIQPGTAGHCDASVGVPLLDVPTGPVDRSMGDVHGRGNPHYLLDPVRSKSVARTVADALAAADPARAAGFRERAAAFARRVDEAMFGAALLEEFPARRLERLLAEGRLLAFLEEAKPKGKLGGWAARLAPHAGAKAAEVHRSFAYLFDRFALRTAAALEPKPGVPPTPRHLKTVIAAMREAGARTVFRTVYQPRAAAEAVAAEVGGRVAVVPHMPGAVEGTDRWFAWMDAAVDAVADALEAK